MPLNFPTSPAINDTYTYQNATYIFDGTRWKPFVIEYSYSGENKSSSTSIVTLDLSKGNVFNIEPIEDIIEVQFTNPPEAVQSFTVKVGAVDFYTSAWNLLGASYDNVSFLVSGQDTSPTGIAFRPDGTKMYVIGAANDRVYQYTLSTAWNLATAVYDSVSFSVGTQDTTPYGIAFRPDGTKMYMLGLTNDTVYQYTLSTAWNIATAVYDNVSFSVSAQEPAPSGIAFRPDGTKMYVVGFGTDRVYQYTLSTAWNIATAVYDNVSFLVSAQDSGPTDIAFRPDGTKMYILGDANNTVYQYTLSTAWNIATAVYDGVFFSVAAQDAIPSGIAFRTDGTRMYMLGDATDRVHQYTIESTTPYIIWPINITWENGITAPLAPERGSDSVYYFITSDGGNTYYGKLIKEDLF